MDTVKRHAPSRAHFVIRVQLDDVHPSLMGATMIHTYILNRGSACALGSSARALHRDRRDFGVNSSRTKSKPHPHKQLR